MSDRKYKRRRGKRRTKDTLLMVLPVILAVLAVAAAVFLILKFTTGGKKQETGTFTESVTEGEREPESTAPAESIPESGPDGTEKMQETVQETASGQAEDMGREPAAQPAVAAEVGSMEDKEDPQKSSNASGQGNGAAVSINTDTMSAAAGETAEATLGIDVSKYQGGNINWTKVKEAGIDFVMVRVGYRTKATGIIYEDPTARYNMQEAQKNGIKVGAYFFSSAITEQEAREEASWVVNFIAKYKITYPVAYNCEDFSSPDSRQYGLDKSVRTGIAAAFLDTVQASGYTPMFYASRNEMEGSKEWDMNALGNKYKIWVSQYPEKPFPETPASAYSGTHAMWQYTSQGQVAGISKKVDVNVAYFGYSREAEAKDPTPAQEVGANPEVGINFTEVNETVTAKIETNLRTAPTTAEGSQVVARLVNGQTATRTGVGSNGWSRLEYNGQKVYAVSSFLTADLGYQAPSEAQAPVQNGPAYEPVNETVTAKDTTNLRTAPGTDNPDTIAATIHYGDTVTRVGIGSNGWSQISYNGQILYAVSSYLTTDLNYKSNSTPTPENPEAGITFTPVNDVVTAKSETNLRSVPSTDSPDTIVGVLHNGEAAARTGIGSNGWSRLTVGGQTVYAVTNYLTAAQ